MKTLKHTPGKWYSFQNENGSYSVSSNHTDDIIAVVYDRPNFNETCANEALLVHAAELLEAAILLSEGISTGDKQKFHDGNLALKEAIKKSTGKE